MSRLFSMKCHFCGNEPAHGEETWQNWLTGSTTRCHGSYICPCSCGSQSPLWSIWSCSCWLLSINKTQVWLTVLQRCDSNCVVVNVSGDGVWTDGKGHKPVCLHTAHFGNCVKYSKAKSRYWQSQMLFVFIVEDKMNVNSIKVITKFLFCWIFVFFCDYILFAVKCSTVNK